MAKPKKEKLSAVAALSMLELIDKLNHDFGENTLIVASDALKRSPRVTHIRTGIAALDIALGGGIARNRITEVRGPFSSFKSTMSLLAIAEFQKAFPEGWGVYIDLERSCDLAYAKRLGVDLDRLLLVNPAFGEEAVNAINALMNVVEDIFMVIDSIAALVPTAEIEADAGQGQMALQARLVNKAMRIINTRLKRGLYDDTAPATTVLALNQLRSKVGVVFGDPEFSPGGMGKDFFYSAILRLQSSPSKANKEDVVVNKQKKTVNKSQIVTFSVKKNKTGGPQHESGEFTYNYVEHDGKQAGTFDNAEALFHYGAFNDVITLDDDGAFVFKNVRAKRESDFIKKLELDPDLQEVLYDAIISVVRKDPVVKVPSKRRLVIGVRATAAAEDDEDDE